MGIKTTQTSHSSKGKRTYNEDIVLSNNDDLFIVCDGVGGETNGKEAAHITAHAAQQYFTKNSTSNVNTVRFSAHIESSFDSYINLEPKCNGMASTLSLCKFYSDRILFLWAGDTRIYHFRNGKILHKTRDHSFAQQMLEQGYLSEQEISTHPHRNVILKAFQGAKKPTFPDHFYIMDFLPSDKIFMCTDGVLETFSDEMLQIYFNRYNKNIELLSTEIINLCSQYSRDNFSFSIINILSLE